MPQHVLSVHHQHAHMISDGYASIDDVLVKSKQVCIKRFCRWSMSLTFVSCTLCCITPMLVNLRHMMTLVHFDEAMIHLMQLSLVISHCNVTF